MLGLPPLGRIFVARGATDLRKSFSAPGKAWHFQRVLTCPQNRYQSLCES